MDVNFTCQKEHNLSLVYMETLRGNRLLILLSLLKIVIRKPNEHQNLKFKSFLKNTRRRRRGGGEREGEEFKVGLKIPWNRVWLMTFFLHCCNRTMLLMFLCCCQFRVVGAVYSDWPINPGTCTEERVRGGTPSYGLVRRTNGNDTCLPTSLPGACLFGLVSFQFLHPGLFLSYDHDDSSFFYILLGKAMFGRKDLCFVNVTCIVICVVVHVTVSKHTLEMSADCSLPIQPFGHLKNTESLYLSHSQLKIKQVRR